MSNQTIARHKRQLRRELRQMRRELDSRQQLLAGHSLRNRLLFHSRFRHSTHIACYLPADGEIDTRPLIRAGLAAGKQLYLPVIQDRQMEFHPYTRGTRLYLSGFGLEEPRAGRRAVDELKLDLVIVPLVGFDRSGARLGMGGGYYDRAFRQVRKSAPRPFLLGVAHACQEVDRLPVEHWDRSLHAVATDREFIRVGQGAV
jgi:5-formyltetrahydrofolate cyclo-ligase